jgi:hypothetical protein
MDILWMAGMALLWGVTALLVLGFKRLEPTTKGQS